LDTIWVKLRNVGLRQKLAWGYAIVFSILFALGFSTVYFFSEQYRKEQFFRRLKDRTLSSYKILVEVDEIDEQIMHLFDKNTINSLYDEKLMLFDSSLHLMYSSFDDTAIFFSPQLLQQLRTDPQIELTEGKYELVGIRFEHANHVYYGVAKAYDRFGQRKITFLRNSLLVVYLIIVLLVVVLSLYLSKLITYPITKLTSDIERFSTDKLSMRIKKSRSNDEVALLTNKFNELLDKVEKAFKFQYHFIHHVSHELKTPLAVMISNVEAALANDTEKDHTSSLNFLKSALMEMSHIINAMLDISKAEHQIINTRFEPVRIDELLFECIDEISYQNKEAAFELKMDQSIEDADLLTIKGNSRMLKMALMNLLRNAVNYSNSERPLIELSPSHKNIHIRIYNDGSPIEKNEQDKIFTHLFRGSNSKNKKGFGLGLVLVYRITMLHKGTISYEFTSQSKNLFTLTLPLFSA
jgi:signal transduction histidine kinase